MQRLPTMFVSIILMLSAVVVSSDDSPLVPVRIQLQWVTQAQFAGYFVAQELEFYQDEGLAVAILQSEGETQPVDAVAAGDAEFGVAWAPSVLIANEQGKRLVNIAQIFQRSGTVLVSFADAGIESPVNLVHKIVGYWPDGSEFEVYALTYLMGSDPISGEHLSLVPQPFHLGPLLAAELDAAQALIYNGYGRLLGEVNPATGDLYQESDFNVIDMNQVGAALLQDHIFADADWLAQEGNEAVALALLRATLRAWIYCRDHADDCIRILLEIDPALGESHQRWQLNEVNKLIWPSPTGVGVMDEDLWAQTVDRLLMVHALEEAPLEGAYRDDLVKQALASLEADGLDVTGEDWQPAEIVVRAGGQ